MLAAAQASSMEVGSGGLLVRRGPISDATLNVGVADVVAGVRVSVAKKFVFVGEERHSDGAD